MIAVLCMIVAIVGRERKVVVVVLDVSVATLVKNVLTKNKLTNQGGAEMYPFFYAK